MLLCFATYLQMDKVFKYSCSYNGIDIDSGKVELDGLDDFKVKVSAGIKALFHDT